MMPLEILIAALDRMTKLVGHFAKRRESSFEQLVEPLFLDMVVVHQDYRTSFAEARDDLRDSMRISDRSGMLALAEQLQRYRWHTEPLRDKVRAFIDALEPQETSATQVFRPFVSACAAYFRRGYNSTPYSCLISDLQTASAVDDALQSCEDLLLYLDCEFANVASEYASLRVAQYR